MDILVGCETSGRVRDALIKRGHNAISCDILPSETKGPHIQGDIIPLLKYHWDALIAFPPCTNLCVSGARWFKDKKDAQEESIRFFMALAKAPIERIAIENPIGIMSTKWRKPDQIIQPWQFGHGETKATCIWVKNLPLLVPTKIVEGREGRIWKMPPSPDRWKERSRTYQGIAEAMGEQWGNLKS